MELFKKNPKLKTLLVDIIFLAVGFCCTAFSVACILTPNGMTTSGLLGISIILQKLTGINYSYLYYGISVCIMVAAYFVLGKQAVVKTVFVTLIYPNVLLFFESLDFVLIEGDMFLASIFFCVFYGIGIGLVLRRGFTFGGTDTISAIIQKKIIKNMNVIKVMMGVDALILLISAVTFEREVALYAFINHFVSNNIMDYVMYNMGYKLYKMEIITPDHHEVCDYIMKELGRGVTVYDVTGGYTNEHRVKLSCICSPAQSATIRRYLAENSPKSFVEVMPMISVYAAGGKRFASLQE